MEFDKSSAKLSRKDTTEKLAELPIGSKTQYPDKTLAKSPMASSRKLAKKGSGIMTSIAKIIGTVQALKLPNGIAAKPADLPKGEKHQKEEFIMQGYDDFEYREVSEIDLLYLPLEKLSGLDLPVNPGKFTRFNDLKRSEGYIRKKNKLTEQSSVVDTMCKRLLYNSSQREHYLTQVSHNGSAMLSKVIESSEKWDKKRVDHMKVLKRNPFSQVDDMAAKIDPTIGPKQIAAQNQLAAFFTEDDRRKHIKSYKLAWYPPSEPMYKNIESLEGSTATMIEKKVYVLGGFRNSSNNAFFCYDVCTDKFEAIDTNGFAPQCIVYHTSVAINKDIFIFGGDSGLTIANSKVVTNELLKLNTQTLEWSKLKPLKAVEPRKHHAACEFGDYMLISGGISEETNIPFKDFHAYHPESNEWFKIHDNIEWSGLSHHTMTPVYSSKIKTLYSKASGNNKNKIDTNDVNHYDLANE